MKMRTAVLTGCVVAAVAGGAAATAAASTADSPAEEGEAGRPTSPPSRPRTPRRPRSTPPAAGPPTASSATARTAPPGRSRSPSPTAPPSTYAWTRPTTWSSSRATASSAERRGEDDEDLPCRAGGDRRGSGRGRRSSSAPQPTPCGGVRLGARSDRARCAQPGPYQLPQGDEPVDLRPADFTTRIDHPYWPMRPGTTWRYVERGGGEVANVRVHRHRSHEDHRGHPGAGRPRRRPRRRRAGGEHPRLVRTGLRRHASGTSASSPGSYEDGEVVSTEGSWKHGRDGAQAGVILPARLRPGALPRGVPRRRGRGPGADPLHAGRPSAHPPACTARSCRPRTPRRWNRICWRTSSTPAESDRSSSWTSHPSSVALSWSE